MLLNKLKHIKNTWASKKVARLEEQTSNVLFDVLEEWENYLKSENINFKQLAEKTNSDRQLSAEFTSHPPDKKKPSSPSRHSSPRLRGPSR